MAAEVGGPPAVCAGLAGATATRGHAVTIASVHLPDSTPVAAPPAVTALAEKRWAAKQAKDFATADALRKEIAAAGWTMLDRKDGYSLEPAKK